MQSRIGVLLLAGVLLGSAVAGRAQNLMLYDGAGNKMLEEAGWVYIQRPRTPSVVGTVRNGVTTLDTMADAAFKAGYSRITPFDLDSVKGYDLRFDLKVISETHGSREDRAGCDVIVLGSDGRGVELAFWTNMVWTQNDRLLHATGMESHAFDTTKERQRYVLHVAGGKYTLSTDGGTAKTELLSGSLHSYAASGPAIPYRLSNYIFIGDDTTSASVEFQIAHVDVSSPKKDGVSKNPKKSSHKGSK